MTTEITRAEYDERLARVRTRMDLQGMSALIVTDPTNIYYLCGYNAWSFYTPQMLFVPAQGDMILFAREMDAKGAHRTTWLPDEQIVAYPERYVHRPHLHPFDWVAFALRRRWQVAPASKGVVGMEMDSHFTSPKGYRALEHGVPEWKIVDCFELVNWVRLVKSDAEIQLMRAAARVTTKAMEAAIEAIEVGVPQNVIASRIAAAQAIGDGEAWGDYPAIVPMLPTGESADTPHLTWSDRRLELGDAVVVELAGAHRRYHVPLARTVMLGEPSEELLRLEEAVAAGLQAVLDAAAPGVAVASLAHAWNWTLAEYGLEKPSRLGYSIGAAYPPDWGERTISIRSEDENDLAENQTFHIICGMWMEGFGYEVSESVRITATGVETFTSFPRGLIRR
ncbi:M24 family metallopeptidase [Mobilicoccus massiliensis]|uniref:M24 family metallopeptidase n=1 Tax=Mobilicoccus massiliensis TaxID=1522310 RepID=UPI00058DDC01|nr:M24 family metallopeptidase [Mobilicoccus massiliensis]